MYKHFLKPLCDKLLALVLLVVLSPVILGAMLLLAIANRGKVFFTQERPGKGEKIFKVIKFKTMNDRKDAAGNLLPDAERLTAVGRFVRSTSIDELPQIFNVLKGDMSFIGPRPLLVQYLPLYTAEQRRRHEVTPGISGWAQVNGFRGDTSIRKRIEHDLYYIENWSLGFDLKIIFLTFFKGFVNKNAY